MRLLRTKDKTWMRTMGDSSSVCPRKIDGCGFSTTHRKGCGPIAVCQRWGLPNTICEISTAVMKKSKPSRRYTNLSPGRSRPIGVGDAARKRYGTEDCADSMSCQE